MTDARAKLYINTGVVTNKTDVYNILRPLLKQTVTCTYYRGNQVTSSGTGWVERIVVDHPEIASYFTPLSICLNLDSFDYLQFDTTSEQRWSTRWSSAPSGWCSSSRRAARRTTTPRRAATGVPCRATPRSWHATCASSRWS